MPRQPSGLEFWTLICWVLLAVGSNPANDATYYLEKTVSIGGGNITNLQLVHDIDGSIKYLQGTKYPSGTNRRGLQGSRDGDIYREYQVEVIELDIHCNPNSRITLLKL